MRAYTVHPNTPESDKQPEVLCEVVLDDGKAIRLMAPAPDDAIRKVWEMPEEELASLERFKPKWGDTNA